MVAEIDVEKGGGNISKMITVSNVLLDLENYDGAQL
jgi:hypothetical protein